MQRQRRQSIISLIGLAGVAEDERARAKWWGRLFEVPMLFIAIWIVVEWYLTAKGTYPEEWAVATNWTIWLFFLVETSLLCILVRDKRRYLLTNWINLVIIAMGVPLLWTDQPYAGALRTLRLLLLFGILFEMSSTIRLILSRNNLGLTLAVAFIIIVMAGISIAVIEPAIDNPWDGIWWAWVTVTTVGYGDIVPVSPQGRVFGGLLMVLGLGIFSLLTASFSAFLITREETEVIKKEEEIAREEERTVAKLERIEGRLEALENRLGELVDRLTRLGGKSGDGDGDDDGDDADKSGEA